MKLRDESKSAARSGLRKSNDAEAKLPNKDVPAKEHASEDEIDEAGEESFPASDPPFWSPTVAAGAFILPKQS